MIAAEICDANCKLESVLWANPTCGHDYCDDCGDCLACYGNDACGGDNDHVWVVYAEQVDEWRRRHPEAEETSG